MKRLFLTRTGEVFQSLLWNLDLRNARSHDSNSQRRISSMKTALVLLRASIVLVLPAFAVAQEHAAHYHHYKFIDLGTLGGPHSYGPVNGLGSRLLNNAGVVTSFADTTVEHPDAPDPYIERYYLKSSQPRSSWTQIQAKK
jgi:hypothetical protein